jgi:hypothetical protein
MLLVSDDEESRFIRLVDSGRKQGAEDHREPHRVNNRFLRCLFSLPSTDRALLTYGRHPPRVASAAENRWEPGGRRLPFADPRDQSRGSGSPCQVEFCQKLKTNYPKNISTI